MGYEPLQEPLYTPGPSDDTDEAAYEFATRRSPLATKRDRQIRLVSDASIPDAREVDGFDFSFSEDDLIPKTTDWPRKTSTEYYGHNKQSEDADPSATSVNVYSKSPERTSGSKITVQRTHLVSEEQEQQERQRREREENIEALPLVQQGERQRVHAENQNNATESISPSKTPRLSRTWTNLSLNSRLSRAGSRSPERAVAYSKPANGSDSIPTGINDRSHNDDSKRHSLTASSLAGEPKEEKEPVNLLSRSRSLLGRRTKGRLGDSPSRRPAAPLLKSFSNSNLPSLNFFERFSSSTPPVPAGANGDQYRMVPTPLSRGKDELWGVFRTLDADYAKFQAKSVALKANVVRSTLVPFLNSYKDHLPRNTLRPEELDRRAVILSKWWTGMLEVLMGPKKHPNLSGVDRLTILDAIGDVMERPEWRTSLASLSSTPARNSDLTTSRPGSSGSNASAASDFVTASVQHNVRTIFAQNIAAQMRYVVDRMSPTHVSPSITHFCGKTCAYAFFFCLGIGDILVRLWNVKTADMRRVLHACGMKWNTNLNETAASVATLFPQCVQSLAFSSVSSMAKKLQYDPVLPLGLNSVQWHADWLVRWSGRDSDLLYSFVKYYHLLLADFLPADAGQEHRLCAPGLVLIRAQMLRNLDSTIHRQATQTAADSAGADASVTFDILLAAAATAPALSGPPANAARLVSENRLIMLMQDMLSVGDLPGSPACILFAESFCCVLRSATGAISLYDQNACFTLCDFLQEAIVGLVRFAANAPCQQPLIDWPFYIDVFKRIVHSQNTTSEIRLYSLLYTIWGALTNDESRKGQLCLDFLLDATQFRHTFRHWCPMVRAYYMRLICWRIARHDGDVASEQDLLILQTLNTRLQEIWSHHKYLAGAADRTGLLPPSTAPCHPAPGRKLLIIRTDTSSIFENIMSLTNMIPNASRDSKRQRPSDSGSSTENRNSSPPTFLERVSSSLENVDTARKRGSIFRSLLGYKSAENDRLQSPEPSSDEGSDGSAPPPGPGSPSKRSSMYEARPPQASLTEGSKNTEKPNNAPNKYARRSEASFKFSLEPVDRRPQSIPPDMVLESPCLPLAAQMLLQNEDSFLEDAPSAKPIGVAAEGSRYSGRALAEWTWVVNECQNFFERRRNEGVPSNSLIETPTLGVESFRRPG